MTIKVGKPDTTPDSPAHIDGIKRGNAPGSYAKQSGHLPDDTSTAARSTGIDAKERDPILPQMPNLSPG